MKLSEVLRRMAQQAGDADPEVVIHVDCGRPNLHDIEEIERKPDGRLYILVED